MKTQILSTLQIVQLLDRKRKSHFLRFSSKEFIRFLCKCIVNLLKGNLPALKRHHAVNFQDEVWLLLLKRTICKKRINVLLSEKGLQLIALTTPPVIYPLS